MVRNRFIIFADRKREREREGKKEKRIEREIVFCTVSRFDKYEQYERVKLYIFNHLCIARSLFRLLVSHNTIQFLFTCCTETMEQS